MLKKFAKTALTAASILVGAGAANASVNVIIQSNGFGTGPIEVISENGTSWTKVLPSDMTLPVSVEMGITSGVLRSYSILQNGTSIGYWGEYLNGPSSKQENHTVTGSTSNFIFETQTVLNLCNDKLNVGQGINQQHTFWFMVPLTLRANFDMTNNDPYPPYEGYGTVPVQVHCKPHLPASNDLAFDFGDMKVKNIKLFLTTYSNAFTRPNPATKCKKVKLLVRLKASKKGAVKFKLWKKVGNGAMTSKVIDAWASHDGNGGFRAEHSEWISVNKTTFVQAKAEEMVNSIGLSTPWEDITLHCTGAGGGGLAGNPSNNDDDTLPVYKLTGDFSFIDTGSPKCERTGKALINFKTTGPAPQGNVHWSIDCTNGTHLSGVAQAIKNPKGGYIAPALASFAITKTSVYSCALKSIAPKAKTHQWKSHTFKCVTRNVETGANDIQVAPKPNAGNTRVPATLVPKAQDKAKADAVKRRREAAKKAAEAKRKREAAAKRAIVAKKKAEAKRKREAAVKKAAEARRKRKAAAAALAKRRVAAPKKRRTSNNRTQRRVMRLR